jgi:cyanophycin synthetase
MIIQEQVEWKEFRVLVIMWEVILVLNRISPYVVWDGVHTINFHINMLNKNPKRGEWYKNVYSQIVIDEELIWFIDKQWFNLQSILPLWKKIDLRGNSNLGTWGTWKCFTDVICEENKKICVDICREFWFEICWIDIITTDISKPLFETWGIILELNDNPWLWWDLELTGINTGKIILEKLFFEKV